MGADQPADPPIQNSPHPPLLAGRRAPVWGDESTIVTDAFAWAENRVVRSSDPKTTARPASELASALGQTITPEGIGGRRALELFETVVEPATRAQDDPMNLAYIPAAPTGAAVAFDVVTTSANIFAGLWEAGAGAIHAENEALAWLTGLLGWPGTAGGCFVSGGTTGNLSALVAARAKAQRERGGRPADGWQVACSQGAHSSIAAAARVMDVEVLTVPEDSTGHLTGPALRDAITSPERVFAVVASAGTTNAGIIDDLAGIADVCEEIGAWMHVDGAYGGAGLASPRLQPLYEGIERAHSFIVDPHKWLFATYDCCALIYRDIDDARAAHAQHASYLDRVDREAINPSDLAIHLSRRARGLPFWFSLATHGTDAYATAIETTVITAHEVAAWIEHSENLRLLKSPELSVVLFDRPGWSEADYDRWSDRLAKAGVILCVPTSYQGATALRLAFVNPATEAEKVIEVLHATTLDDIPYPEHTSTD
ncbi:MAG: pyridoxal phosphate-dependent decarboxylase family protein [Actinomycetales bacterium]